MLWSTIRSLHLLAMAFFIGGQLMLACAVVPVLRGGSSSLQMQSVARRFGYGTLIAIAVLLITGAMLATQFHRWSDPTLHTKLTLVAVAGGLLIWHMRKPKMHVLQIGIFLVSVALLWLGVTVAH